MTVPVRIPRSPETSSGGSPGDPSADEVVFAGVEGDVARPPATQVPGPTPTGPLRPGWLRARPPAPPPLELPDDYEPAPPTWLQRMIGAEGTRGLLTSLVLHTLVLVILSLVMIHQAGDEFGLTINSAFVADDAEMIADIELQGALDDPGKETAPLQFVPVPEQLDTAADFTPADQITGTLDGEGQDNSQGAGGQLPEIVGIKVPKYAITKGSFSVWTEPKDPIPGRPYHIVIQIRVPTELAERAKVFSISRDMTADVRGTDGFTKRTSFKGTEPLPIKDGYARTFIVIPGAQQLVRDHIKVTSKMLKETQEFDIEF